jgi:hypothetical protein
MSIALGALAVVLAGLGGPNPPKSESPEIIFRFKLVEIRGLEWRAAHGHGLRPVASRGGVSAWTAPRDFLKSLPEGTVKEGNASPSVAAAWQSVTHITMRQGHPFVTQASWRGDDLPPRETTEQVREGMTATIRGRRLDQGILAHLVIEDTDVHAVHTVDLPAAATGPSCCPAAKTARACEQACPAVLDGAVTQAAFAPLPSQTCCAAEAAQAAGCAAAKTAACAVAHAGDCGKTAADSGHPLRLQIPEIGRGEIAGEWLIPRDEVLLVGFGPHTVADESCKAAVRERLAVITAEEIEDALPQATTGGVLPQALPTLGRPGEVAAPGVFATVPGANMPALPSRTLPQGVTADGAAVDLPPLPDDSKASDPADSSAAPQPSPQTRRPAPQTDAAPIGPPAAKPSASKDARASKAAFAAPLALFRPAGLPSIGLPNLQFTLPLKPLELKLPLNQKLQLELLGRVVPDTDSAPEGPGKD